MAVVLLSGGMDSTIALYHTIKYGRSDRLVHAITFDYGQRHVVEVDHASTIFEMVKAEHPDRTGSFLQMKLDGIPNMGSLLDDQIPVRLDAHDEPESDPSFIPHRNALFITVAAMWCRSLSSHMIVTGIRGGFSDCTYEFELAMEKALYVSDPKWMIGISSPMHDSRAECVNMAIRIDGCIDALAYTLTCFQGMEPPCGLCLPCTKRAEGFAQVGMADPLLERLNGQQ